MGMTRSLSVADHARLCAAIADRITFRCPLIQNGAESNRLQTTRSERHVMTHR